MRGISSKVIPDGVLDFAWKTLTLGSPGHVRRIRSFPSTGDAIVAQRQVVLEVLESACHHRHGHDRLVRVGDVVEFLREDGDVVDQAMAARIEREFALKVPPRRA